MGLKILHLHMTSLIMVELYVMLVFVQPFGQATFLVEEDYFPNVTEQS